MRAMFSVPLFGPWLIMPSAGDFWRPSEFASCVASDRDRSARRLRFWPMQWLSRLTTAPRRRRLAPSGLPRRSVRLCANLSALRGSFGFQRA